MSIHDNRPSPLAGRWYPGNPQHLAASVDSYLAPDDPPHVDGQVVGLLAPHAGHRYSGAVAGRAFALIQGLEVDIVALIGPSHYPYNAAVLTSGHAAYSTPLGHVPIAHDLLDQLRTHLPIEAVRNDEEHSLEIELPFLQRAVHSFQLLPLALIDQSLALAQKLGHALAQTLVGRTALLVASSDLSHFYPQSIANTFDQTLLAAVATFDPAAVIAAEEQGIGFACGRGAIATVMLAAQVRGANAAQIVGYATSGDVLGDYQRVVGYGAAAFYQTT